MKKYLAKKTTKDYPIGIMKMKPFKIEVEKPKARKPPVPAQKAIKSKKQYTRKNKYKMSFLDGGYEL